MWWFVFFVWWCVYVCVGKKKRKKVNKKRV